jgi:hypothetical protein
MTVSAPTSLSGNPLFLPLVAAVFLLSSALLLWRFLGGSQTKKTVETVAPKKLAIPVPEAEPEDLTKKKVSVFFGTQTGTAEGFAKVRDPTKFPSSHFFFSCITDGTLVVHQEKHYYACKS